jgi:hypothetical protein
LPDVQYPDDPSSDPSSIRIEDLLATDDDAASPASAPPPREGLPRSFRMRADKHYVEMLDTPQQRSGESSAPASRPSEMAAPLTDPSAVIAVQAGRDLAQSLSALRASTNLLSDRGPALASTVAGNLIRAEVWRATCLLQASRFLRGEISAAPKPVQAQAIIGQVLKAIEPERRLRGVTIDDRINLGDVRLLGDEDLLVTALSTLMMATIALTEDQPSLAVTVSADLRGGEITIAIGQEVVRASSSWATDSVPVAAAERIVAASGGRIVATVTASGTDVRVTLPAIR